MTYSGFILFANPEAGSGGGIQLFVTIGLMFVVMYIMLIRPQRKKQKAQAQLLQELKKGDRVLTNGGMFGTIFAIDDQRNIIVLKINDTTRLEFLKSAITTKVDQ